LREAALLLVLGIVGVTPFQNPARSGRMVSNAEKPFNPLLIGFRYDSSLSQFALARRAFPCQQVSFIGAASFKFPGCGLSEALGRTAIALHLWHSSFSFPGVDRKYTPSFVKSARRKILGN
jgi:hypothetical protein